MTHRNHLPEYLRQAHGVLDRVLDGQPISKRRINEALRLLGDMSAGKYARVGKRVAG